MVLGVPIFKHFRVVLIFVFLLRVDPWVEGKNEKGRVGSPETLPVVLKEITKNVCASQ